MHRSPRGLSLFFGLFGATAAAQEPAPPHHTGGLAAGIATNPAPLYTNLGTYSRTITTSSPVAQQYFDQGLRLTYAFNHEEAVNSFQTAISADSTCAMCWWGLANALGPNINAPMDTSVVRPAYAAAQRAQKLATTATPRDQALIAAMTKRYAPEPVADRAPLDSAYASAMRDVARRFPTDADAQALYAEAMMDLTPWNYWTQRGRVPRPGTTQIVQTLERTIAANPNHPGACHFYIHTIEASTTPSRALPCANRLAQLMPGAGHLVHMPSHIYMRTGRYDLVASHNHDAVHDDEQYIQDRRPTGFYHYTYYPHNYHMMWAGLMMLGRSDDALTTSRKIVSIVPVDVAFATPQLEYFMPTPYFSLARFERWDEMLAEQMPKAELTYTKGMWHYTRGLAFAAKNNERRAKAEFDNVATIQMNMPAEQPAGINSAKALLDVAQRHLAAKIALLEGDTTRAIAALESAIEAEDALRYDEPPAWYLPLRQELGTLYLTARQPIDAEKMFREDLDYWPENGWSLRGLEQSLRAQKKVKAADAVAVRFNKAWSTTAAPKP